MHVIARTLSAAALLLGVAQAQAAFQYQTTLTLTNPDNSDIELTSAVFDWETAATSGTIDISDLLNLTLTLLNGATLVFTDVMILNSLPQPIGGAVRALSDISFDFDLDSLTLNGWDNDLPAVQQFGTGETFNFYGGPDSAAVYRYVDGSAEDLTGYDSSQVTLPVDVPVAPTALLLLGGLPLLMRRRKG